MQTENPLLQLVLHALEERKATDIRVLDVRNLSNIMDIIVIASGTSNRQVVAIAGNVMEEAKHNGYHPIGTEGQDTGEWVLVDLGDVVVHVMQPHIRDYYQLERLWSGIRDSPLAA